MHEIYIILTSSTARKADHQHSQAVCDQDQEPLVHHSPDQCSSVQFTVQYSPHRPEKLKF